MKILPINIAKQQITNTGFKGLWGKTINNDRTESEYNISETIYEYYPFADETKEQIEKVKNENSRYKEDLPGKGLVPNPWPYIDSVIVSVMAALPFTAKEFMNYTLNKLPITKQRLVERYIMKKGLSVLKK